MQLVNCDNMGPRAPQLQQLVTDLRNTARQEDPAFEGTSYL